MSQRKTPPESYVAAFANLAALTAPKCAGCRAPFRCCSAEHCEAARSFALETFGIVLQEAGGRLPFLAPNGGCTVPPHLRPLCTVHVCEMHLGDGGFAEAYFVARESAEIELAVCVDAMADSDDA